MLSTSGVLPVIGERNLTSIKNMTGEKSMPEDLTIDTSLALQALL